MLDPITVAGHQGRAGQPRRRPAACSSCRASTRRRARLGPARGRPDRPGGPGQRRPGPEFAFSATSVGRLALCLHQAIRGHRIACPPDEVLPEELASVRLRKNTLGIYRLDHDSGRHDDQAVALALGTYRLLATDQSAAAWIRWARQKAELAEAECTGDVRALEAAAARRPRGSPWPWPGHGGTRARARGRRGLDPAAGRKQARDEAFRASPDAIMMRAMNGR